MPASSPVNVLIPVMFPPGRFEIESRYPKSNAVGLGHPPHHARRPRSGRRWRVFRVGRCLVCGLLAGAMSLGGRAGYGWPGDGVAGSAGGSLRQFAGSGRLAFLFLPSAPRDERRTRPGR